jgi:CheY-like chemotaxis protein
MNAPSIKVLVIDDEPPIRKLLRMGLSTQGYDILEAPNGKTALELLAQGPALIILDLGLPDIRAMSCSAPSARAMRPCRSWCCRAAATRPARCRRSTSAPTTI